MFQLSGLSNLWHSSETRAKVDYPRKMFVIIIQVWPVQRGWFQCLNECDTKLTGRKGSSQVTIQKDLGLPKNIVTPKRPSDLPCMSQCMTYIFRIFLICGIVNIKAYARHGFVPPLRISCEYLASASSWRKWLRGTSDTSCRRSYWKNVQKISPSCRGEAHFHEDAVKKNLGLCRMSCPLLCMHEAEFSSFPSAFRCGSFLGRPCLK